VYVSDIDIEHVFTRPDVQNLLKRITGFNIDRVFRHRQIEDFGQPKYKLLTPKQLEEVCCFALFTFLSDFSGTHLPQQLELYVDSHYT
jgi:Mitochondrial 28S ribosomal protein S22